MKIKFFAVGGTIDKVYFDALSTYQVGPPGIENIIKDARVNFDYEVVSLIKKDSLEMTAEDRELILEAIEKEPSNHIVVTHGTDTMVDTALVLKKIKDKVIVLTGAMEPACFKSSDAAFNLGSAVASVQTLPQGVYISISGRVFDPSKVKKDRDRKQFVETQEQHTI
ncbi:AspG [Desulfamplus magnetovallimortis]|uniref:AspG n=1 Tax=Desulfamplus magnetovallimortis TaxID=1246637 RepID=A0A1W1H6Y7_9BACT|nr:asparaginase domain-containing protein [Desulfamplus magnetovallimortis]SLM28250.1 AspG [Desulfamplus magnetovallimortis]